NPKTGETVAVTEDGGHQGILEWVVVLGAAAFLIWYFRNALIAFLADIHAYIGIATFGICITVGNEINNYVKSQNGSGFDNQYFEWQKICAKVTKEILNFEEQHFSYLGPIYTKEFERQKQQGVLRRVTALDPPVPGMLLGLSQGPETAVNTVS